jgi:hypothetical protein
MKAVRLTAVVFLGLLLIAGLGCSYKYGKVSCASEGLSSSSVPPVHILQVEVTPPSGTGAFQLTVDYE